MICEQSMDDYAGMIFPALSMPLKDCSENNIGKCFFIPQIMVLLKY